MHEQRVMMLLGLPLAAYGRRCLFVALLLAGVCGQRNAKTAKNGAESSELDVLKQIADKLDKILAENEKRDVHIAEKLDIIIKCGSPARIDCRLKHELLNRHYQFAIIGGLYLNHEIIFWNSDGTHSVHRISLQFYYHSAAVLPDTTVLITGGIDGGSNITAKFHLLNLTAGVKVLSTGRMTGPPRYQHNSAALSDGRVFVCGGITGDADTAETLSMCSQYENGRWKTVSSMNTKRHTFGMASDGRFLYAVGGYTLTGTTTDTLSSAEYYDPDTDSWEPIASLPNGPRGNLQSIHSNGKVYAIGGWTDSSTDPATNTVEVFDTVRMRWSCGPSLNTPRYSHTVISTPDGSIWAFGGLGDGEVDTATSVEVLPSGGNRWIPWPHKLSRPFMRSQVVLV